MLSSHAIVLSAEDFLTDLTIALQSAPLVLRCGLAAGISLLYLLLLLLRDLALGRCGKQ